MGDRCDQKIYEKGTPICLLAGPPAKDIEAWVKAIAKKTDQRVDWHFVGGRAVVKFLGKPKGALKVIDEITKTLPRLRAEYAKTRWPEGAPADESMPFMWCDDVRAIVEPHEQARVEQERVERQQQFDGEVAKKMAETVYLVEADSFASHQLWHQWCWNADAEWEEESLGSMPTIGTLAKMPVTIHLTWAVVAGQRICFWYMPSQVTDHRMAEAWLKANMPNVRRRSDALNFGNIISEIQDHLDRDIIKYRQTFSSERCPTCKRR